MRNSFYRQFYSVLCVASLMTSPCLAGDGEFDDDDDLESLEEYDGHIDIVEFNDQDHIVHAIIDAPVPSGQLGGEIAVDHSSNHQAVGSEQDRSDAGNNQQNGENPFSDMETDFNWGVLPFPRIFLDRGREIVRLGPNEPETDETDRKLSVIDENGVLSNYHVLDVGLESDGHRVKDTLEYSAGVGAIGGVGSILFSIGGIVVPIFGRSMISNQIVGNYEDAKTQKKLKKPKNAESLDLWNDNDELTYWVKGGISVLAAVSITLANTGPGVTLNGEWMYCVKKLPGNSARVTIKKKVLANLKYRIGYFPVVRGIVGVNKLWSGDKTYEFDLGSQEGRDLFSQVLKGRLKNSQKKAMENSEDVEFVAQEDITSLDRLKSAFFGFPLVFKLSIGRSTLDQKTIEIDHLDDLTTEVRLSAIRKSSMQRRINNVFRSKNRKFFSYRHRATEEVSRVATRKTLAPNGHESEIGHYGQLVWEYSNDHTTLKQALKVVEKIAQKTGSNDLKIKFPEDCETLGYVNVEFSVVVSESAYSRLAKIVAEGKETSAGEIIFEKFARTNHGLSSSQLKSRQKDFMCQLKRFSKKIAAVYSETDINKTSKSIKNKNINLSKLGRIIMNDPLLLETLCYLETSGIEKNFSIKGEQFRPLRIRI